MAIGDLPSAELQLPGERRNGEDASRERGQETTWRSEDTGMGMAFVAATASQRCRPQSPEVMT